MAEALTAVGIGIELGNGSYLVDGSTDPSSVGYTAPEGSIYCRTNGEVWLKVGSGDTDWNKIIDSGGASTEDGFQNTFMGKTGTGSETPTFTGGQASGISSGTNLEQAIDTIDQEIGTAVSAVTRTSNPVSDQDVNSNIEALDAAIGADSQLTPLTRASFQVSLSNSIYQNFEVLDSMLGADSEVTNTNYVSTSSSIFKNLSDLDGQVKANADAIAGMGGALQWRYACVCITDDGDLRSASDGVTLSTLLPFSDDEGTALVIGDFSAGNWLLSRHTSGTDKLWKVYDDGGTLKLSDGTGTTAPSTEEFDALGTGDAFIVLNDLVDSPADQENESLWVYNGTDLTKVGDIDWGVATGINLSGTYTAAASGSSTAVAASDSLETAIGKLDGAQKDILTTLGVSQGDTNLGAIGGGAGADEILTDTETVKSALIKLGDEIGVAVTGTNVLSDQAVNLNLDAIDTAIGDRDYTSTHAAGLTDSESLTASIEKLNLEIGAAVTGTNVISDQAINLNFNAIDTAIGDRDYTSTHAAGLTDSETLTASIEKLNLEIGAAVTNTDWTEGVEGAETSRISDQAINLNIDELAQGMGEINVRRTYTGTPTNAVIDTFTASDSNSGFATVQWIVEVHDATNSKKESRRITGTVDVTGVDVDWSSADIQRTGSGVISGLSWDVTISGSTVSLELTASVAVDVKTQRLVV